MKSVKSGPCISCPGWLLHHELRVLRGEGRCILAGTPMPASLVVKQVVVVFDDAINQRQQDVNVSEGFDICMKRIV